MGRDSRQACFSGNPPRGSFFKCSQPAHDQSPITSRGETPTVIAPVKASELKTVYIAQIKEIN